MAFETYLKPSAEYFDFCLAMARIIAIIKEQRIHAQKTGVCYNSDHDSDGELCFTCYYQQKAGLWR